MIIALEELMSQLAHNPEQLAALRKALAIRPSPEPPPSRFTMHKCPNLDAVTLCQMTFFDNGPKSVRKKGSSEFAVTIEIWTRPKEDIKLSVWQWKKSVPLIGYWQFGSRISTLLSKGSISQSYYERLHGTWSAVQADQPMFGLIGGKHGGTVYYDQQFVIVPMVGRLPQAIILVVGEDELLAENLDAQDMKGQPLKGLRAGRAGSTAATFTRTGARSSLNLIVYI